MIASHTGTSVMSQLLNPEKMMLQADYVQHNNSKLKTELVSNKTCKM